MNTFLSRLNTLFAFSLSVTAGLTFACFLTTHFLNYGQDVDIDLNKIVVRNLEEFYVGEKHDLGNVLFTLKANMTPVFNWNCKQLFIYLMAEYETPNNKLNQVVLWDHIIKRGENSEINLQKSTTKYHFFDDGSSLRGKDIQFSLNWNVIPNAGYLWNLNNQGNKVFTFPSDYSKSRY